MYFLQVYIYVYLLKSVQISSKFLYDGQLENLL